LEEVLAPYDPISQRSLVEQAGFHPPVASQAILGIILFCLGYPDQALAWSQAAIVEALSLGGLLLLIVSDNRGLGERADHLFAVATEQGFPFWRATGPIYRGWLQAKNGDVAEGISLLRSGSAAYRATGAEIQVPLFSPSSPRQLRSRDKLRRPRACWTRDYRSLTGQGSAGLQRS
jgi:hypothetical protein